MNGVALSRPVAATAVAVLVFGLLLGVAWQLAGPGNLTPKGEPVLPDFGIFYTAGRLALDGHASQAYRADAVTAAFEAFFGVDIGAVSWNYPPPLLLPVAALAGLPYLAAAGLWGLAGLSAFVAAVRALAPGSAFLLAALLFPGTTMALLSGQTALLAAAALAGGLALLERRPLLGGALLGLLVLKPNLAVLLPLALLAGRRWPALAAAAGTALALALLSVLAYGPEPWQGFLANLKTVAGWDEAGLLRAHRMPSVYMQLKTAGLAGAAALVLQLAAALGAAAAVVWAWRRPLPETLRGALLASAVPLASPYVFEYDLALLVVPLLLLGWDGLARGWRRGEAAVLVLVWVVGVLPPAISEVLGFHPGIVFAGMLFALAFRRCAAAAVRSHPGPGDCRRAGARGAVAGVVPPGQGD